ncbi:hypothetical protein Ahy_B05g076253 [Arachis hypogaea]|uniref:Uncharacterized protein n=1 Tax=Arachis hypogaea TaxID=3818 RepID=A0A444Z2V5_ARAHY|nr:hypothetical protein Ahy_B05g076253 [Arachis hypogaea]
MYPTPSAAGKPLHHQCQDSHLVAAVVTTARDSSGQLSLGGRMNSRTRCEALERIVGEGDRNYIWKLRMNTNAFANLYELLQVQGGLKEDGHAIPVEEDCLDPTWRRFKAHPTKFYSPGKPFPLFYRLEGIFGRDRTTGAAAVSGLDAERMADHIQQSSADQRKNA